MFIQEDDLKLNEWQFSQRKYLPYETKLRLTETRMHEWFDNWNGQVYVSYSGGLDSTVLLHFARKVLGENIPAVFCNTGLEFPEIVQFARKANGEFKEIYPADKDGKKIPFKKVILNEGYPIISKETAAKIRKLRHGNLSDKYRNYLLHGDERGSLGKLAEKWKFLLDAPFDTSEKCCDVMKKKPFKKYTKETGIVPFVGVTQDESFMRERKYAKTGCNVYDGNTIKSQPLGFWTKQDILRFVYENNIPICSVYGDIKKTPCGKYILTGEQRTGCMFCGFGCQEEAEPNRFQRMEKKYPNQYDFCMKPIEKGGLGMAKVLEYAGIPYTNGGQMELDDYLKEFSLII